MTATMEHKIGKVLRWKSAALPNSEVSNGHKVGRPSLAKGLQHSEQKTNFAAVLPRLERWLANGSASFDQLEMWHVTVRRAIYLGAPDAIDSYAECFSLYTNWLAKATARDPMAILLACLKQYGFVKGAEAFRDRVNRATRLIATWADPSQMASLAGRNWEMTEEEAKVVSEMLPS